MIRIGVLGCGRIAERHIMAYKKMPMVDVSVADVDVERARSLGRDFGIPVTETPEALLSSQPLDAVDVCVPTVHHKAAVLMALKNGTHVFCEKPLSMTLKDVMEINEAALAVRKVVMVGHLYRFHPAFQFVKEVLEEGIIGRPYFALFRLGGRGSHVAWKHQADQGGGAILEMLVHKLDLVNWYFGEIRKAASLCQDVVLKRREIAGAEHDVNAEDLVVLKLSADGVEIICESDLLTPSYMNTIEIHGSNGSVFSSILHFLPTIVYCKNAKGVFNQGNNIFNFPQENLFEKELRHFTEAIKNGGGQQNSIEDSIRIFQILDKVKSSR